MKAPSLLLFLGGCCFLAAASNLRPANIAPLGRHLAETEDTETTTTAATATQTTSATAMREGKGGEEPVRYRGVNLGGWLVLESWMYPDWWKTTGVETWVGEWQFCEALGPEKAKEYLEEHWDTWVTKKDFEDLKKAGIEHLRVPIGYWILGEPYLKEGEPYVVGGWAYLERAMGWAKELGLKMIIDLHGAPGAQNGNDNDGFSGGTGVIQWNKRENLDRTNEVLVYLAKNLTEINKSADYEGVIVGLCILNEPWTTAVGGPIQMDEVKTWVQEAVDLVIEAGWTGHIWYPDGFNLGWQGWKNFLMPPQYKNVFIESHIYFWFDPSLAGASAGDLTDKACTGYYKQQLENANDISSGVVVGEWSMDFKQFPEAPFSEESVAALRKLFLAQAQTFGYIGAPQKNARGGTFWSFKCKGRVGDAKTGATDNPHSPWDFLAMWTDGIAPPSLAKVADADLQCANDAALDQNATGGQDPTLPGAGGGRRD